MFFSRSFSFSKLLYLVNVTDYVRLKIMERGVIMSWLWTLIVGAIIGAIAGAITNRGNSMGCIANIIAGLVGSSLGQALFGSWGPSLANMAIVPSVLGAVILVLIISFIFGKKS